MEQKVNELRELAQRQAEQAKRLSVPGEMDAAQRNLTLALDLREEALAKIATARARRRWEGRASRRAR